MNFGFYCLVFDYTPMIGADSGWGKYEFFVFVATTYFVNSLVEMFFYAEHRGVQRTDSHWRT